MHITLNTLKSHHLKHLHRSHHFYKQTNYTNSLSTHSALLPKQPYYPNSLSTPLTIDLKPSNSGRQSHVLHLLRLLPTAPGRLTRHSQHTLANTSLANTARSVTRRAHSNVATTKTRDCGTQKQSGLSLVQTAFPAACRYCFQLLLAATANHSYLPRHPFLPGSGLTGSLEEPSRQALYYDHEYNVEEDRTKWNNLKR